MRTDAKLITLSRQALHEHKLKIELIHDQYKFLMYAGHFILANKCEPPTEHELSGYFQLCEHVGKLIAGLADDLDGGGHE